MQGSTYEIRSFRDWSERALEDGDPVESVVPVIDHLIIEADSRSEALKLYAEQGTYVSIEVYRYLLSEALVRAGRDGRE